MSSIQAERTNQGCTEVFRDSGPERGSLRFPPNHGDSSLSHSRVRSINPSRNSNLSGFSGRARSGIRGESWGWFV